MTGAVLGLGAHGVGMRLRRVPHAVRVLLDLLGEPPDLLPRPLPHGLGLLQRRLEQPPRALAEGLVRLRGQLRHMLLQQLGLHLHVPGEHGEPGRPLPGGVPVLRERLGEGLDLFGAVATPS